VDDSLSAFYFYADTSRRRGALSASPGAAERYVLFGLDQEVARGVSVQHNLEGGQPPSWARAVDRVVSRSLRRVGGTGGDLASPLAQLRAANRSDVVVATSDRLGLPLTLLARARMLRTALVYISVGLPERLALLEGRARHFQIAALRQADSFVAYSAAEADAIRAALGPELRAPVQFVPFGVDPEHFRPESDASRDVDVVSIGADPHRDHALLLRVAAAHPEWRFRLVLAAEAQRVLGPVPDNVEVEAEVPFGAIRDRLLRARAVALPVRENSYSGGTTVLLQAMAAARAVVVSRTTAIASGYGLADGVNCRLVAPGDDVAFGNALAQLLADDGEADALGLRGRAHVVAELTWQRYADAMHDVLVDAVRRHSAR
jgi:glycosyltransferase involved in cell wall biosynthesis